MPLGKDIFEQMLVFQWLGQRLDKRKMWYMTQALSLIFFNEQEISIETKVKAGIL